MRAGTGRGQGPVAQGGRRPGAAALGAGARQAISDAHGLERSGNHQGAATQFAELARRANVRSMPGVAMHLALEGVRNRAQCDDPDATIADAIVAIGYAASLANRSKASHRFGALVAGLRAAGHEAVATKIEEELRSRLDVSAVAPLPTTVNRSVRRNLATHCATCGAPVDSAKVTYEEDGTADCTYCGVNLLA